MTRSDRTVPSLDDMRVRDVMSAPIVSCAPGVPLREVAELMSSHRIHSVVVRSDPADRGDATEPWGVIAELDLVAAAPFGDEETTAGRVAGTPVVTIGRDESLARAAMLMSEYAVTHLVAVDADGAPEGIVSALDIAGAVAPPEEPAVTGDEPPPPQLRARPGDRLLIVPHHLGEPARDGEILEAQGAAGGAPFLVRWEDTGRVSLFYPGSDARIERLTHG